MVGFGGIFNANREVDVEEFSDFSARLEILVDTGAPFPYKVALVIRH